MENASLYERLARAYTLENLNKITYKIIDAHRSKNFTYIKNLAQHIGKVEKTANINRLFSRLIILYHPDRLAYYEKKIKALHSCSDRKNLKQLSHIWQALEYVDDNEAILNEESLETEDQYKYDSKHYGNPFERNKVFDWSDFGLWAEVESHDFISAFNHKEYGNIVGDYQGHDFSSMDEIELSGYNISDLTGIHQCYNLSLLDLSNNNISDINSISHLHFLEWIDLSHNEIIHVNALSELHSLQDIDLSFNRIKDIMPLLHLNSLRYLDITGNHIAADQIDKFSKEKIIVIF